MQHFIKSDLEGGGITFLYQVVFLKKKFILVVQLKLFNHTPSADQYFMLAC